MTPKIEHNSIMGHTIKISENDAAALKSEEAINFIRKTSNVDPSDWGTPGYFSEEEYLVFYQLKTMFPTMTADQRDAIMCFGDLEGLDYALCRWLRARKFVLADTLAVIDEAVDIRKEAKNHNFFPEVEDALHCPAFLYLHLYPQIYTTKAKSKAVLFISKPGQINANGLECVTSLKGIFNYHWHEMHHNFAKRLRMTKEADPDFKRFECFCILDLAGLSASSISSRVLHIIKTQSKIDNTCYVETMNKLIIVNAPSFFSASWGIIKRWLDVRTQNKIEIFSSMSKAKKRLLELVDEKDLSVDYGGTGESFEEIAKREFVEHCPLKNVRVNEVEIMHLRSHASIGPFKVEANEKAKLTIYSRSSSGALFKVTDGSKKVLQEGNLSHKSAHQPGTDEYDNEQGSKVEFNVDGPVEFKIRADSHSSRLYSDTFVVSVQIYEA